MLSIFLTYIFTIIIMCNFFLANQISNQTACSGGMLLHFSHILHNISCTTKCCENYFHNISFHARNVAKLFSQHFVPRTECCENNFTTFRSTHGMLRNYFHNISFHARNVVKIISQHFVPRMKCYEIIFTTFRSTHECEEINLPTSDTNPTHQPNLPT